jgi:hypothetical protein
MVHPTTTPNIPQPQSINPIEPIPQIALFDSYTYHSPLPCQPGSSRLVGTNEGEGDDEVGQGWVMGIDEAGRGRELIRGGPGFGYYRNMFGWSSRKGKTWDSNVQPELMKRLPPCSYLQLYLVRFNPIFISFTYNTLFHAD